MSVFLKRNVFFSGKENLLGWDSHDLLVSFLTADERFDWYCNLTAWENLGLFKIWTYESVERDYWLVQASTIFTDPENRAKKSFSKISSFPLRLQDVCNIHRNVICEVSQPTAGKNKFGISWLVTRVCVWISKE